MTEATLSEVKAKAEIAVVEESMLSEEQQIKDIVISDTEGYSKAGDLLKKIKDRAKNIEEKRVSMVEVPNKYVKWVNDMFRPLTAKGEDLKRALERKMLAYSTEVRKKAEEDEKKRREEEAKKLKEEQDRKESLAVKYDSETMIDDAIKVEEKIQELAVAPVVVKHTVKTESSMTYVVKKWTGEVQNADLVPREYMTIDQVKINKAIALGARSIPGVRIYEKESIGSR